MKTDSVYYSQKTIDRRVGILGIFFVVALIVIAAFAAKGILYDVPDAERPKPPVSVFRDSGTGCQYLVTDDGALMPRMDVNGRQICQQQSILKRK